MQAAPSTIEPDVDSVDDVLSESFPTLSVQELSPRIVRSIRSVVTCQKASSPSRPSTKLSVDSFVPTQTVVEPLVKVRGSCLKGSNVSSSTKKSVRFQFVGKSSLVKSKCPRLCVLLVQKLMVAGEIRYYDLLLKNGQTEFLWFSPSERAHYYGRHSNAPHEFAPREYWKAPTTGETYHFKGLGVCNSPSKVGMNMLEVARFTRRRRSEIKDRACKD